MWLFMVPFAGGAGLIFGLALTALFWCSHVLFGTPALGDAEEGALVLAFTIIGAVGWLAFCGLVMTGALD